MFLKIICNFFYNSTLQLGSLNISSQTKFFLNQNLFPHLTISEQDLATQKWWLSTEHLFLNCDLNGTQLENRSERSS